MLLHVPYVHLLESTWNTLRTQLKRIWSSWTFNKTYSQQQNITMDTTGSEMVVNEEKTAADLKTEERKLVAHMI